MMPNIFRWGNGSSGLIHVRMSKDSVPLYLLSTLKKGLLSEVLLTKLDKHTTRDRNWKWKILPAWKSNPQRSNPTAAKHTVQSLGYSALEYAVDAVPPYQLSTLPPARQDCRRKFSCRNALLTSFQFKISMLNINRLWIYVDYLYLTNYQVLYELSVTHVDSCSVKIAVSMPGS